MCTSMIKGFKSLVVEMVVQAKIGKTDCFVKNWIFSVSDRTEHRRCHEKTSYVSNYAFITLLHEWVDRGQKHQLEKLLCVIPISSLEVYYWSFSN